MNKEHKPKHKEHEDAHEPQVKQDGGVVTTQDEPSTGEIGGDGPGPIPPTVPPVPPAKQP